MVGAGSTVLREMAEREEIMGCFVPYCVCVVPRSLRSMVMRVECVYVGTEVSGLRSRSQG